MATTSDLILYRYSPENMDEAILRKLFVGREKLLKSMVKEIENAARKKTPRFFLLVGPRGIGKSHFLVLLYHEIKSKFGSLLIPIKLREEEYSVYRASDLFLRILEEKKEDTKEILSLANEDEILHAAIEKLKFISKRDGKRYIIFIENLHELFKQLDEKELKKLRSIFQKYDFFSLVASAPMIFPGISEHDEPFYNFFQVQFLSEFSLEEIKDLIQKIAKAENNKKFLDEFEKYEPKIHGMVHLTGGSPRLVILFYEMITRGELENIENAFFKIIDEHTPYYQEIFQLLTGQKRRIFDAVISSETPITPKQISEVTRLELPTVTTQLGRLETDGYVISRPMGRYTKYEVRERLFRLWREMRQPLGKKRVSILLEFLQYWYTPEERKELFKMKFELLEAGDKKVLKDLCYVAEILPPEFKAEALLKLTTKLIEFGEREEAAYEIQKLKETATQIRDRELEGKIPMYEGRLLISEEKYEEALEAFNRAIEINPKDDNALSSKGAMLGILSRHEEALEAFNKAIEINPKNDFALSMKGTALINLGRHEEALEAFNKAIEVNPKNDAALSNKGIALANLGRHKEALEAFNKVIEINPKNDDALSMKGTALINLGRHEEALEAFNKAIEVNPKNDTALSNKGITLANLGRHEEALEASNKAIEINPKNVAALSRKGAELFSLGKHEEALEALNKAIEINPKYDFAFSMKGFALANLGRHEETLETSNKAIEINPKNDDALLRKGLALENLGRYEDALEAFNKALEINPNNEFALSRKGDIFVNLGRYEDALETLNKVLEINPKNDYALSRKVAVLERFGRHEEALEAFNRTLEINPNNEFALMFGGIALINLGRNDGALEAFNKAIEINPKIELIISNIRGTALVNLGKNEEAIEAFNKALKINPNDESALSRKGLALGNLGRYEDALEALTKALEINPNNEFALSKKGFALGNLRRHEEALGAFNTILKINPMDENALRNKGVALLKLKRYSEALEVAKRTKDAATSDSYKIDASLLMADAYISLDRKTDAILEIEKIKNRIANQPSESIENFIEICMNIALIELKAGNRGNGAKFIKIAFDMSYKLEEDKVVAMTMTFLKGAADSGLSVVKAAIDEVTNLQGDKYQERVRPIIKAIEIVETKDIQRYYNLQVEEREIVADIVRKITKSDELLPEGIKRKESR